LSTDFEDERADLPVRAFAAVVRRVELFLVAEVARAGAKSIFSVRVTSRASTTS
jgi:hypothetical protein